MRFTFSHPTPGTSLPASPTISCVPQILGYQLRVGTRVGAGSRQRCLKDGERGSALVTPLRGSRTPQKPREPVQSFLPRLSPRSLKPSPRRWLWGPAALPGLEEEIQPCRAGTGCSGTLRRCAGLDQGWENTQLQVGVSQASQEGAFNILNLFKPLNPWWLLLDAEPCTG